MPVTKGTQLLGLMQDAISCDERYASGLDLIYVIGEQPKVELVTVKSSQVRRSTTPGVNGEPLAIENNPSLRFNF